MLMNNKIKVFNIIIKSQLLYTINLQVLFLFINTKINPMSVEKLRELKLYKKL